MNNVLLQEGLKLINQYNRLEKKPYSYGTDELLYPSEIHVIDEIAMNKDMTTTRLSQLLGITKGGVSQITAKLLNKKLINKETGDGLNEVYLTLTEKGIEAYRGHRDFHKSMINRVNKLTEKMDDKTMENIMNIIYALNEELEKMEEMK